MLSEDALALIAGMSSFGIQRLQLSKRVPESETWILEMPPSNPEALKQLMQLYI